MLVHLLFPVHCPQHFLYFLPLPQGQGAFRPTLSFRVIGATGAGSIKSPNGAAG